MTMSQRLPQGSFTNKAQTSCNLPLTRFKRMLYFRCLDTPDNTSLKLL